MDTSGAAVRTEAVRVPGPDGLALAGRLEMPGTEPAGAAVFAHCFTCGKQSRAATRISRALAARGFAVLRFDMPGIGESAGEFVDSLFASRVDSVVHVADYLRERHLPPRLLVGHSLGGATVVAAAAAVPEVRALATIAAPFDPAHVTGLLASAAEEIAARGQAEVHIAGQVFAVSKRLVDDLADQPQRHRLATLDAAILVLHSPTDTVVGIDHAAMIFRAARHPKSFVALDGADHLLSDPADAEYAAAVIAAWAQRYLGRERL